MYLRRLVIHVLVPLFAPLALVGLYLTPITVIPCATRGLIAIGVVFVALIAGIVLAVRASLRRRQEERLWWAVTIAILTVPAVLILGPLG